MVNRKIKAIVYRMIAILPCFVLERGIAYSQIMLHAFLLKKKKTISRVHGYYGQYGQDQYVWEVIFNKKLSNGVFVDIGAYDGILNSNTCFFERMCGFSGVLIEANPGVVGQLRANRTQSVLHCGVANIESSGSQEFLSCSGYGAQLSCFRKFATDAHLQRINAERIAHGFSVESVSVPLLSMREIINQKKIKEVDILSIDVEGAEVTILEGFPFEGCPVNVIIVEANQPRPTIGLLRSKGFSLRAVIGTDLVFQHREHLAGR